MVQEPGVDPRLRGPLAILPPVPGAAHTMSCIHASGRHVATETHQERGNATFDAPTMVCKERRARFEIAPGVATLL